MNNFIILILLFTHFTHSEGLPRAEKIQAVAVVSSESEHCFCYEGISMDRANYIQMLKSEFEEPKEREEPQDNEGTQ